MEIAGSRLAAEYFELFQHRHEGMEADRRILGDLIHIDGLGPCGCGNPCRRSRRNETQLCLRLGQGDFHLAPGLHSGPIGPER